MEAAIIGSVVFLALTVTFLFVLFDHAVSGVRLKEARLNYDYDVIIVGGSIAGPVMAKALADQNRRVLLLERSLFTKPNRIVGELLQPGGMDVLMKLGMDECAKSVGMPCHGYVVLDERGDEIRLPYAAGLQGFSFHFGDLVNNLRKYVWQNCQPAVTMLEATVTEVLVERVAPCVNRAYGVVYTTAAEYNVPESPFTGAPPSRTDSTSMSEEVQKTATAPLVIMCDGGSSKFKAMYQHYDPAANYHSHFVGLIIRNARLPQEGYGTVFFGKKGPILSYRLDPNELRVLVDYNKPALPSLVEQSRWLSEEIAPCLPSNMQEDFIKAAQSTQNIRSMPIAFYPATFPSIRGYVGIGDHANQRHPLTGGGMTCAFSDAFLLAEKLLEIKEMRSSDVVEMADIEDSIQNAIVSYARGRVVHSSSINILSWALYAVFGTRLLRNACLEYFARGGECVSAPMALLAGVDHSPQRLLWHYTRVMFNGALNLATLSGPRNCRGKDTPSFGRRCINAATFFVSPFRVLEALYLLIAAACVAVPVAYSEFVSIWRLINPTGFLSSIYKTVRVAVCRSLLNGRKRKPIGL
ncbi:squalene monooxygenase, putative [Trypanosoma brucei gambiense DAL972]|uniref:Squalene monooxygenase n=2 Tax=Trypanosoma brucei TaxID=5691 RepID=D0A6E5_TRYB9|nr:squalene monooxygenase, putative [Trypanosoma brucei gambiense DAL972]RHW68065.1 squalene monooxygenase [Trypanosoma brucei equiperdum]CBH17246.1 squalene monooxygenase, putative [Trypanosoma brucei gambiense DAL972]|eukprot:XP_011779510.1 squalene monooxygenase, putative [Trypanosoma brucei gambiense DAL972]